MKPCSAAEPWLTSKSVSILAETHESLFNNFISSNCVLMHSKVFWASVIVQSQRFSRGIFSRNQKSLSHVLAFILPTTNQQLNSYDFNSTGEYMHLLKAAENSNLHYTTNFPIYHTEHLGVQTAKTNSELYPKPTAQSPSYSPLRKRVQTRNYAQSLEHLHK